MMTSRKQQGPKLKGMKDEARKSKPKKKSPYSELCMTHTKIGRKDRHASSMTRGEHFTSNSTRLDLQHHCLLSAHVYPMPGHD